MSTDQTMQTESSRIAELEQLAHRTWPCREEGMVGNWILRAADGFTRRANSCLTIGEPGIPLPDAVDRARNWYRDRNLQPCFKITPSSPDELDPMLQKDGWKIATPARVLSRRLDSNPTGLPPELQASAIPDADWLRTVSLWDSENPDTARRHAELAMRVQAAGFLRWRTSEGILAVGLVAMDGLDAFLYDVVVHPERRGRGIGRAFCTGAMAWAASCGVREMALQVLESNIVGRGLYASIGFRELYAFHYRITASACSTEGC